MKTPFLNTFILIVVTSFLLSGCGITIPTHTQRVQSAKDIAGKDVIQKTYESSYFNLFTYSSLSNTCKEGVANVYIEGDGLAWISSSRISKDPTPINPQALKMFTKDKSGCKVYMARPCQYANSYECSEKYWTSHRFSKKVIQSYDEILQKIKIQYSLKGFRLIGYSGGGAVAALTSATRDDIDMLVTAAGNLDTDFWTKKHYITPLSGSLNPADYSDKLEHIKQFHLIGEKDRIIDRSIFESYKNRFENKQNIKHKIVKDFTHGCCWAQKWQILTKGILN